MLYIIHHYHIILNNNNVILREPCRAPRGAVEGG